MNASQPQVVDASSAQPTTKMSTRRSPALKGRSKSKNTHTPAARKGSKTAKILALLARPEGASLKQLQKATGWQAHSVRGFLSGALKKKMRLRVDSKKREDGERAYRIAAQ
jgi:hypothetical protein